MNEILNGLLGSELLTEDTRKQLSESLTKIIEEAKESARQEVKVELSAQFLKERNQLVEAIDTTTQQVLETELKEFKEDIKNFRDLEVDFANRLIEERAKIQTEAKNDLNQLVETIDNFLDAVLEEQFKELKEDINECKKIRYGQAIFEAVQKTFEDKFANKDDISNKLKEANAKLQETNKKLTEAQESFKKVTREQTMHKVLESLNGRAKELMEVILTNVPTEKLNETYAKHISKVLTETVGSVKPAEKETNVLAENVDNNKTPVIEGKIVTGELPEKAAAPVVDEAWVAELKRLQRLSGQ